MTQTQTETFSGSDGEHTSSLGKKESPFAAGDTRKNHQPGNISFMTIKKSVRRAVEALFEDADRAEAEKKMGPVFGSKLPKVLDSLATLDPQGLAWLFATAEFHASPAAAREIATHVLRPEETAKLVARLETEAANQRAAREAAKAERKTPRTEQGD